MNPVVLYREYDFDFEPSELEAMRAHFRCVPSRTEIRPGEIVIGRYSVLPFYRELEKDLSNLGAQLINNYTQHRYIADMRNWYQDLAEFTPKTWFRAADVPMDEPGSFVLKGETNSKKFQWNTHMFAATRADIGRVLSNLQIDALISTQDVYVRQYIPLKTYAISINDLPITEEYRFFICDGEVLSGAYYWSSYVEDLEMVLDASVVPKAFLQRVIDCVGDKARFWVLDVARTAAGDWIVIELNDGQMSGLSENDLNQLYGNLKRILN